MNLVVVLGLLAALEALARAYVAWTRGSQTAGLQERTVHLSYRPFVMYGPDWDTVLAAKSIPALACRVLLVGGSTAAGFPLDVLELELGRRFPGRRFEIFNGAHGGYEARQEVVVASLWGPALEPHVLISLDGANDLSHRLRVGRAGEFYLSSSYAFYLTRPVLTPFVYFLSQSQLYNGAVRISQRHRLESVTTYADAVPVYIESQRSLNALARGMGSIRVMVLQPFSAFKSPLSDEEATFTLYKYREEVMKALFVRANEELQALSHRDAVGYLDARLVFEGIPDQAFTDDVHLTALGYRVLAGAIADRIHLAHRQKAVQCDGHPVLPSKPSA